MRQDRDGGVGVMRCGELLEAIVQVGATQTRYVRCGRGGRTLVVLAENGAERLALIRRYAADRAVVAPLPDLQDATAARPAAVAEWLRGLMEGLGLDRPAVLLAPSFADAVSAICVACETSVVCVATSDELDASAVPDGAGQTAPGSPGVHGGAETGELHGPP